MEIRLDSCVCQLERCDDFFFMKARERSMPIQADHLGLYLFYNRQGADLQLPQSYACLVSLFGAGGELYDHDRGAFAFPFKLTVARGAKNFKYLAKITNYRSYVDINFWKVLGLRDSYDKSSYPAPLKDEFSEEEIRDLISYLFGFFKGYFKTMPRWTTPFLKEVESNLILFGYSRVSGDFFEVEYKSETQYRKHLEKRREEMRADPDSEEMQELPW